MDASTFNAELGKQQFLQLFVTQLKHQDPLEPVGQQEFLAQLAQFSTVEGLENLNSQFSDLLQLQLLNNGAELLGRTVTHGEGQTGVVEAISQSGSQVLVRVGDHLVPLSDVQTITDTQAATQTAEAAATDSTTTETATTTDPIETFFRLGRERE